MLARAAGLAAAGLAIDAAGTGRLLAAVQRAAPAVDWLWSGAITAPAARGCAPASPSPGPVRLLVTPRRPATPPRRALVTPTAAAVTDGVVHLRRRRPQPDTAYRYAVETAAGRDERTGHFRTFKDGAALLRVRLRILRVDRIEQPDLRHHPPARAALLPAPRRLPLRQHRRRRSVALPRRLEPRAALAAPVGALPRRRRSSTSSTTTTTAATTPTARR